MPDFARLVLVFGVAVAAPGARPAAAQNDTTPAERWQVTVDSAHYIWDVRLVKLAEGTLIVRQADSLINVPVARISEMRLIQKSTVQIGGEDRGVMNALTGADDEIYDFTPLNFAERLRAVQKILLYHPPGG